MPLRRRAVLGAIISGLCILVDADTNYPVWNGSLSDCFPENPFTYAPLPAGSQYSTQVSAWGSRERRVRVAAGQMPGCSHRSPPPSGPGRHGTSPT